MVCFPNAKINLGLHITGKLSDGYHTIETVFYPVNLCDILEIIENKKFINGDKKVNISGTGLQTNVPDENNLCFKAYSLLDEIFKLPPVTIHLHKIIPMGAGLGGGSADAAFTLTTLTSLFNLNCSDEMLTTMAAKLGADCAFFIFNKPSFAQNKGEELSEIAVDLKGNFITIIKPAFDIATAMAYKKVNPKIPTKTLKEIITLPHAKWSTSLENDFEKFLFPDFPELHYIKKMLYNSGAWYASLSGSGSAVFGLFTEKPILTDTSYSEFVFSL